MSDSQAYEELTVASDGVTVTKQYEADEFPVPAIAFNFESRRTEPVTVTLSDVVPDDVAVEDLGFHPEYGSEYWTIDDDEISFERVIEPDSEYTTVYGIRATGTDKVEQFLTEPVLEQVDPPMEDDETALVGEGSDAVRDVISGEADSVPGLDDVEDEDVETLDLKDPNGEGQLSGPEGEKTPDAGGETRSTEATATTVEEDGGDEQATAVAGDSLVAALATELRNQDVNKEDVKLLRKAFDLATEEDGSVVARVEKLQRDVDEVAAYSEALERFLDENGDGDQVIEDFRTEMEELRERVEAFESDLDGVEDSVDDVAESVSSLESEVAGLREDLEAVREDVGDGDLDERVEEIDREIADLKEWREQLSSVIGGMD